MIKNQIKSRSWTVQYCDKWSNIKQATTQILKMTGNYIRGRAQWTTTQWTLKLGNKNIFYLHNFMSLIICSLYYYFFLWKSSKNFFDNLWWVRWSAIFSYLAWSAPFVTSCEVVRKLGSIRLIAPRWPSMAAGAVSLKLPNFLTTSQDVTKGADQANNHCANHSQLKK